MTSHPSSIGDVPCDFIRCTHTHPLTSRRDRITTPQIQANTSIGSQGSIRTESNSRELDGTDVRSVEWPSAFGWMSFFRLKPEATGSEEEPEATGWEEEREATGSEEEPEATGSEEEPEATGSEEEPEA